jgi:AcrR family transcriptional regulator
MGLPSIGQYACIVPAVSAPEPAARRRARIAEAVLDLVAQHGLEEVSIRHVAARAGVSVGMVQHHFRTKDDLMRFALQRVSAGVQERLGAGGETGSARELVRTLFVEVMPFDERRTRDCRVVLAFMAYAAVRPEVGDELRDSARLLREYLAAQLVAAPFDPAHTATALLALIDGLGVQVVSGQLPVETAVATFDAVLNRLVPVV